jgi:ABC-type sugar transport system ATPase subunit
MVYQEFGLIPHLSVGENVLAGRLPLRKWGMINWSKVHTDARSLLDMLGSSHIPAKVAVMDLPMSDQQEVAIARAFSYDPKFLVMDEPTSSLSLGEMTRLHERLRALRDRGVGIVYISHKLDEVFGIADRVTVLRDGSVVSTDDIGNVNASTLVAKITGKEARSIDDVERGASSGLAITESILELENLSADGMFSSIDLVVGKGEVVGVAGLIGAGKTELARAIFGALPNPQHITGTYRFDGREVDIRSLTPSKAKEMGIGFVTENRQEEGLILDQSAYFNTILPNLRRVARTFVIRSREAMAMTVDVVRDVNVRPPEPKKLVKLFSGGNQQKIVIGKWLATRARLIILDEPTRGVDVGARQEIYELVRQRAREEGVGVLLLSSDLQEVLDVSDRIIAMRRGRIVGRGARHEMSYEALVGLIFGHENGNNGSVEAEA